MFCRGMAPGMRAGAAAATAAAEEAAEAVAGAEARAEAATQEAERMRRLLEAVPPKPVPPTLAAAQLHGDEPTASTSDVLPP